MIFLKPLKDLLCSVLSYFVPFCLNVRCLPPERCRVERGGSFDIISAQHFWTGGLETDHNPDQPRLCWRLCLWPHDEQSKRRGGPQARQSRRAAPIGRMGRAAQGSARELYLLERVREAPAGDCRQCFGTARNELQYCSTSARPRRNSARRSGRFSSREMVDCEHNSSPEGKRSSASLNIGSPRNVLASLPSS